MSSEVNNPLPKHVIVRLHKGELTVIASTDADLKKAKGVAEEAAGPIIERGDFVGTFQLKTSFTAGFGLNEIKSKDEPKSKGDSPATAAEPATNGETSGDSTNDGDGDPGESGD